MWSGARGDEEEESHRRCLINRAISEIKATCRQSNDGDGMLMEKKCKKRNYSQVEMSSRKQFPLFDRSRSKHHTHSFWLYIQKISLIIIAYARIEWEQKADSANCTSTFLSLFLPLLRLNKWSPSICMATRSVSFPNNERNFCIKFHAGIYN